MTYRFASPSDYSDYAGGRVLYSYPGRPAFPVRLASELFQQALAFYRRTGGGDTPCTVYDPCCGGATMLTGLAFLHWPLIGCLIGSDVDAEALALAARNLALLSETGLQQRRQELMDLLARFNKNSHRAALASLARLTERQQRFSQVHSLPTYLFSADATNREALSTGFTTLPQKADLILADVPYGEQTSWHGETDHPLYRLLDALPPVLAQPAVVALAARKGERVDHPHYLRLKRRTVGRRQILFFQLA